LKATPKTNFVNRPRRLLPREPGLRLQNDGPLPQLSTPTSPPDGRAGTAPYSSREWFIKYADRILFGTDAGPSLATYQVHFRFLETADEYFSYASHSPIGGQGRWNIYGVYLPDEVLRKVYHDNAAGC